MLYRGTKSFAQASSALLENLYSSLANALNRRGVPVYEAEFPLVAVIFNSEDDFRRHKPVASEVQAYYELLSNRIFFFEKSRNDRDSPESAALLKPQTVAHEGTHQILPNIGVQQRLSNWPLWLVEGLAEYCASPKIVKNGSPTWNGLGQVNLLHMAALRDLEDPLSTTVPGAKAHLVARDPKQPMVEYLVTRTKLSPTDYALSWALTYYLATKRVDDFLDYLRAMSRLAPFEQRSPEDQLRAFKVAFGTNLGKLGDAVGAHLGKLKQVDALAPLRGDVRAGARQRHDPPGDVRQPIAVGDPPVARDLYPARRRRAPLANPAPSDARPRLHNGRAVAAERMTAVGLSGSLAIR